jgi:hypothetical protein
MKRPKPMHHATLDKIHHHALNDPSRITHVSAVAVLSVKQL